MKRFAEYFGSYLTGIAAVVAILPIALVSLEGFPLPMGGFSVIFSFMCTVSNYLIIGMGAFYKPVLRKILYFPPKSVSERATTWILQSAPLTIFVLFIFSSGFYLLRNEQFLEEVFVNDGMTVSWLSVSCIISLVIMFIGPIFALVLMAVKDIIDKERRPSNHASD